MERGFGLLPEAGEPHCFRILLVVAHACYGERRFPARFDGVRSGKRALRKPLHRDSEWRQRVSHIDWG
jgi:hypothetical protein